MRSANPASSPDLLRAHHAGGRSRQHGAHRQPRRLLESDHAAVRLRQMRRRGQAKLDQAIGQPPDVAPASPGRDRRSPRRWTSVRIRGTPARRACDTQANAVGELLRHDARAPSPHGAAARSCRGSTPPRPPRPASRSRRTASRRRSSSSGVSTVPSWRTRSGTSRRRSRRPGQRACRPGNRTGPAASAGRFPAGRGTRPW